MNVRDKAVPQTSQKQTAHQHKVKNFVSESSAPKADAHILLDELIGKQVCVTESNCKDLQGLTGKVLDETKNTFLLATSKGRKRVPKASSTFSFQEEGTKAGVITVKGELLCVRPEDRTKKLFRKLQ